LIELGSGRFGRLYEEMDKFSPEVKSAPVVQLAVAAYNAIKEDNYVRFFALARSAPYLVAVLLNLQFNRVRARALEIICAAYLSFPLATFVQQLAFENEEHARDFLDYYSVSVDENAGSGGATIQTKQVTRAGGRGDSAFQRPPHGTTPYPHRNSSALVGSKRPAKVSTAVLTGLGRGEHIGIESFVLPQAQAAAAAAAASANTARVRMVVRVPKPSPAPSMDADMISRAMDAAAAAGTTNGGAFGGPSAFGGSATTAKPGRSSTAAAVAAPIPSLLPAASFPSRPSFGAIGSNGLTSAAPSFELPSAEALSGLSSKPTKITRNIAPSSSGGALTNASNGGFGLSAFPSTVAAPPISNLSGAAAAPSSSSMLNPRAKEWMPPSSTAAGTAASAFPSSALSATASAFAPAAAATSGGFGTGSAFAGFGPAAAAASTTAATTATTAGGAGFGGGFGSSAFGASATTGATATGAVGFGSSFPTFGSGTAATGSAFGGASGSSAAPAWGTAAASSSSASASSAFAPASSSASSFSTSAAALSTKPSPAPVSAFGATSATTAPVPPAATTPPVATVAAGGAFGFGAQSTEAASTLQRTGASVSTKPPPPSSTIAAVAPVSSFAATPAPSKPQQKPQLPETTTTNIAGFQLPVAGSIAAGMSTSSSPPVSLVSPPAPMLQAPPVKSKPSAAAVAEAPVAHPRPPMRSSAVAGAAAALPAAAASKPGAAGPSAAGGTALAVRRAPSEAVFMDTTEPTRAASIAALQQQPPSRPRRRPTTPTPARLQEMFLQSLRAYRRSLLSMALAGWRTSFAAAQKAREEKEAFECKLNARADAFAATKWFLRWHDSMRRQREAQERFNTAQALLHAPPIFLLSAKTIGSTAGVPSSALSPKLLLPASSDVATLAVPAGGVASGLSTPLVKLHRMGLDVPVDATAAHDGGDDYDGPQGVLDFADAADYDEEEGEYAAAAEGEEEEEQEGAGEGEGEGDGEYIEGDEDGDDVYADEEGEGQEEENGQDGVAETEEQAADGVHADLAPMDHAEDDDSPPTPSRSLLGARGTRSPAIHGRTAAVTAPFGAQFASPPAFGALASAAATPSRSPHIAAGPGLSSSHKRSRQSLEIDRFLSEYVSPRRAMRQQQQQQSSPAAAAAALYSLDGASLLLEDDSEAEDDARVRAGAAAESRSSRAKLFHTPSRDAARAMFASPTTNASSSALDVTAALHAASASPSSELAYLRPPRYGSSSPFASPARFGALLANGSSAAAAASASLSQKVASEVRASGKLDELMQQLEYRFGAAV
jgi:hypothetical protein